jgi:hypothetical protein
MPTNLHPKSKAAVKPTVKAKAAVKAKAPAVNAKAGSAKAKAEGNVFIHYTAGGASPGDQPQRSGV